jgi:mycothiol synthase
MCDMLSEVQGLPAGMTARLGTRADADAILRLLQQWDLAELGEIDTDLTDVLLRLSEGTGETSRTAVLVWAKGQPFAAGFLSDDEGEVYVRPNDPAAAQVEQALLRWLVQTAERNAAQLRMQVFANASERQARYAQAGLGYAHSVFQYRRSLTDVPDPVWPEGVDIQHWVPERDARDVHTLIRAAFREVPGHPDWTWSSWSGQFLDRRDTDVITVREHGRLVGAAVLSCYDNYGHLPELAVHQSCRGRGLGKALLAASFRQFAAHGLPEVRLSVYASNQAALHLYTEAGMTVFSEWQLWTRPG